MTDDNADIAGDEALDRARMDALEMSDQWLARVAQGLPVVGATPAALAKEIQRLRAERSFCNAVLAGLVWTGDGYEWDGGGFDYRLAPNTAIDLMRTADDRAFRLARRVEALEAALRPFAEAWEKAEAVGGKGFARREARDLCFDDCGDEAFGNAAAVLAEGEK